MHLFKAVRKWSIWQESDLRIAIARAHATKHQQGTVVKFCILPGTKAAPLACADFGSLGGIRYEDSRSPTCFKHKNGRKFKGSLLLVRLVDLSLEAYSQTSIWAYGPLPQKLSTYQNIRLSYVLMSRSDDRGYACIEDTEA